MVLEGPTEQQRHLTRNKDKVFLVRREEKHQKRARDGGKRNPLHDVYHIEIQVEKVEGFEERMVTYWGSMAQKYKASEYRIHQFALWPLGNGYPGHFQRDRLALQYQSVSVPDDLDPEELLASSLAPLALWASDPPADVVDRVADSLVEVKDPDTQLVLVELSKLGPEPLAILLIEALKRRGMSDVLAQTTVGQDIARRSRDEERLENLTALLEHNYGTIDDLTELARKLVAADFEEHRKWVMDRVPLEQLRSV
ncbi:hypothetical protein [Paractinoplanes durhamensis]|uniref:Uncharacterized protein n=1 Tax=Paractinoplanes durhamensis TaxID=113563 RepID=A0ABQ3Z8V4_9ACTN|nr:hypothetical protein Adu01nite_76000 [Actinoplanes durhamensis]